MISSLHRWVYVFKFKMSLSLVVGLQSYLVFNVSFFLSVLLLHCIQLTEQVRHQMQATLQEVYGVNLDHSWNRKVTDSWDKAQTLVRRTQLVLSLGSGLPFLPGWLVPISIVLWIKHFISFIHSSERDHVTYSPAFIGQILLPHTTCTYILFDSLHMTSIIAHGWSFLN